MFGDEDDLARDTAGLGVAQRGGGIREGEATGDLRRDGPLRQAVENLTKVATQLGTVASGPQPASGPQVEDLACLPLGSRFQAVSRASSFRTGMRGLPGTSRVDAVP